MRCPVCGQVPPRGANFCFACGASLARACPECRAGQSPEARFCPECGTRLPARPGEAAETPDETAEAFDEAIGSTRGRQSRWRVAAVAGAILLLLAAVAGSALWLGAGQPRAARVPAIAPSTVTQEPAVVVPPPLPGPASAQSPPASPGRVGDPPSAPPQSETTSLSLPDRSAGAVSRSAAERAPGPAPRAWPTARSESPAASPQATPPRVEVSDVRVEITTERLPDGVTRYRVRLRERDGTPVRNVAVTVRGRRADGVIVEAPFDATPEPGVYHAVLRLTDVSEPRLRVARAGRVKDLPLSE